MSNYVPRPNTGTLWPNNRKSADTHPDYRGDIFLDAGFLQQMIAKADGELIKLTVSCWEKTINGQLCYSASVAEPYNKPQGQYQKPAPRPQAQKPAPKNDVEDDDVPF